MTTQNGTAGKDTLTGTSGSDTVFGLGEADEIDGGDGPDSLYGGAGTDTIEGGAGDDQIEGGADDDTLYGGTGDDQIYAGTGDDSVFGGSGNDTLYGDSGADSVYGGDGSDFIDGGDGNDSLFGGDGADTISNGTGDDWVYGGLGDDTIFGGAGDDLLDGGGGNDLFFVDEKSETDTIVGGENADDNDTLNFADTDSTDGVTLTFNGAESGNYSLNNTTANGTFSQIETFETTEQADTVDARSSSADQTFDLFGGDDQLLGGSGDDTVFGGGGNDHLSGGAGSDQIDGGDGDDDLHGDAGYSRPVILLNFEGGNASTAVDESGNGFDGTYSNGAAETGAGFTGMPSDTALQLDGTNDYVEIPPDDAFQLQNGTISIRFNADSLTGTSTLFSRDSSHFDGGGHVGAWVTSDGSLEVRLQSDSSDTWLSTGPGAISVGDWNHVAFSFGDEGAKLYLNGDVVDTDSYAGGIEGNSEPWVIGTNQRSSSDGVADNLKYFFDGRIDEFALFDTQVSPLGVTQINDGGVSIGTGGADTLSGGDGNDDIYGGAADDTLFGGADNDTLAGGSGNDTLTGGTGEDVFEFNRGAGDDVITDFDTGDTDGNGQYNDQLDVSGLQNPDGSPVTVFDVNVVDDGAGNAKLVFPEGESIVLSGVTPAQMASNEQLIAAGIPCFTPGTLIMTDLGERPIETLRVGDRVFTRDHGFQPIRWIGQRKVAGDGRFAPVVIQPGVVTGLSQPLLVSPQHRMLFSGYRSELLFGESEVFVAATHLIDDVSVTQKTVRSVSYIHLMLDSHEVIYANGAATESFHPGDEAIAGVTESAREELFTLFPALRCDLSRFGPTARRCLRRFETQMLQM